MAVMVLWRCVFFFNFVNFMINSDIFHDVAIYLDV